MKLPIPILAGLTLAVFPVFISFAQEASQSGTPGPSPESLNLDVETIEEVIVRGVRRKRVFERDYVNVEGKRFFDGPYGNQSYIVAIGQELKNRGEKKRIFTRRIKMPQDYPGSSLDRYRYPLMDDCGIENFSFYDGGEFMALGLKIEEKEIIFDVLIGGGPFSSPGIWGPYDQILGKRHGMKLIMGDSEKDGMGLLKSGYAIGMKADMPNYELNEHGDIYSSAIDTTGQCLADKINIESARQLLTHSP